MDDIKKFIGKGSLSVSETMQMIDNNQNGILFVNFFGIVYLMGI